MEKITRHEELKVYILAYNSAMEIFELSKTFPKTETYSLTDQIRRSSRSVCANIAEAFYRRKYPKSFIARLTDAEAECAETRVWLNFAQDCNYIDHQDIILLLEKYSSVISMLISMIKHYNKWTFE